MSTELCSCLIFFFFSFFPEQNKKTLCIFENKSSYSLDV